MTHTDTDTMLSLNPQLYYQLSGKILVKKDGIFQKRTTGNPINIQGTLEKPSMP